MKINRVGVYIIFGTSDSQLQHVIVLAAHELQEELLSEKFRK